MPDEEDIFDAFGIVDELLAMAPATDPPEEKRHLPTIPGRIGDAPYSLQKLAKDHTERAFNVILQIMEDEDAENSTRLEAAKQILDRGWGKPAQQIRAETVRIDIKEIEAKLLEQREEIDVKIDEARRIECERVGEYIDCDAEVVEDASAHSSSALQDYS